MIRRRAVALFTLPAAAAAGATVWMTRASGDAPKTRPNRSPSVTPGGPAQGAENVATDVSPVTLPAVPGIVPAPIEVSDTDRHWWILAANTRVRADVDAGRAVAELLAADLRAVTGHAIPVVVGPTPGGEPEVALLLRPGGSAEDESYEVEVAERGVTISAVAPVGLYRGAQTVRQLVPAQGPFVLRGAHVRDAPRYPYRGIMIDPARHFYTPTEIRRLIDHVAAYKFNILHLHLTDDQGWRLAIEGWPGLTGIGAATQVGGGRGGFWSAEDYAGIVAYAQERFITVVPEFDMPGHTNAAIVAYPELACDGVAHTPYTGTQVGFSSLCITGERTYAFVDDVLGKIAALTPGPYLHIGGDEAKTLKPAQFRAFMARVQPLVAKHGKRLVAWHQLAEADPLPGSIIEYWGAGRDDAAVVVKAAKAGCKVVMAPADHAYLDMKYAGGERLGVTWAGTVSVRQSYEWEPSTHLPGMPADAVIGVEGALWGETIHTVADAEYLMFPRLAAVAEAAWSAPQRRGWPDFLARVHTHEARWTAAGINWAHKLS